MPWEPDQPVEGGERARQLLLTGLLQEGGGLPQRVLLVFQEVPFIPIAIKASQC